MIFFNPRWYKFLLLLPFALLLSSCTAGDPQFTAETPAGFWWGLWHGMISIITLIIHIFNNNIAVYETFNSGGWYDFGFLLGVILVWGGSSHMNCKTSAQTKKKQEWQETCEKVETKVMKELKQWAEDDDKTVVDKEWEEIGKKVEKKLKRKIREWAEKD